MGKEIEMKYRLTAAQAGEIAALLPEQANRISMKTTYYDTKDASLAARRWTLRLRMENEAAVCTLKTPGAEGGRGEWECLCGDILEAIPLLCAEGAPGALAELTAGGVEPVCGAEFVRRCVGIPLADGTAELALDTGVLTGGGKNQAFTELEVELKSGSREALFARCRELEARFGLKIEPGSKFQRALALKSEA